MLAALLDGRALTAGELAFAAHVSPQTASGYLARMTQARLLNLERRGRHAWYRLASPLVGRMIEGIMAVAAATPARRPWKGEEALRTARTCYDHLAGRLGVALADRLTERGHIELSEDGGEVTAAGAEFLNAFGLDLAEAPGGAGAPSAAPAWTGASGDRIWPGSWARPWRRAVSSWAGCAGCRTPARWPSPSRAVAASRRGSASRVSRARGPEGAQDGPGCSLFVRGIGVARAPAKATRRRGA